MNRVHPFVPITVLTLLAFAIHGYHPYSEDGGLYVAGIKRLLNHHLYTASAPFVDAPLRHFFFAPAVATSVRTSGFSLPAVLLLLDLASLWALLYAFWLIAEQTLGSPAARWGAVLLFTLCLTIPIAGTSLFLVDPYVTARSISLPCTLFALYGILVATRRPLRGVLIATGSLILAALMHPLMAAFAVSASLLLAGLLAKNNPVRRFGPAALCLIAVLAAAVLQLTAPPEPGAYLPVALSRYYWFLSRWQWYELLGLAAPLAILTVPALGNTRVQPLVRMAVLAGTTGVTVALLFAHAYAASHLVAHLQPLRVFQLVYIVMILFLGSILGEHILRINASRWLVFTVLLGTIFFAVQRSTYPASNHIEWPGRTPANAYEQAFVWIRGNTPVDALFALDAYYISAPGEDAQGFRALAERSALPDYSKDGGEAAITPSLVNAWTVGQRAQTGLNQRSDADRLAALRPLNVTWVVLARAAKTAFDCPFHNGAVQICRLP